MSNRNTIAHFSFAAVVAIVALSYSMLTYAQSSEENVTPDTPGIGSLIIEQQNPSSGSIGEWTLLIPGNEEKSSKKDVFETGDIPSGTYTIIADPPDGMTASIRLTENGTLLKEIDRQQMTFTIRDGERLNLTIYYHLSRYGEVSVTSDPPGLTFTIQAPNKVILEGKSPASYEYSPEGQYSIQFDSLEGCPTPAAQSDRLEMNKRISFNVKLDCEYADKIRSRLGSSENDEFVTVSVDGTPVQLRDVPTTAWFASHVFNVAKNNILSGYKDKKGNPSGEFGPENNVTLAELAKIAHRLSGTSEGGFLDIQPENPLAANQWFSPFIASAEARGWVVFQDTTVNPLQPATRAEVVITLLQALDVPLEWQKGNIFFDVTARTKFASAIETASNDGVVEGRKDESGAETHMFAPDALINRAEMAKLVDQATLIYRIESTKED